MADTQPYNPLDKRNLAESVAKAILSREPCLLTALPVFPGPGVYALYYSGTLELYQALADDGAQPIYVGKASPKGRRRGGLMESDPTDTPLLDRRRQHARSLDETDDLKATDFRCRYLVVDEVWIDLAEQHLIALYKPVWNVVVDGFGNHDPGSGRQGQCRSPWDTLHPGRTWAAKLAKDRVPFPEIREQVRKYLDAEEK
ncbi:MAG: Eco29kI family restriction endonuclease [Armatimonadetes bacterium]|nr:Eco29kI family restriction endonuclease [Armatimonadota bacterium]